MKMKSTRKEHHQQNKGNDIHQAIEEQNSTINDKYMQKDSTGLPNPKAFEGYYNSTAAMPYMNQYCQPSVYSYSLPPYQYINGYSPIPSYPIRYLILASAIKNENGKAVLLYRPLNPNIDNLTSTIWWIHIDTDDNIEAGRSYICNIVTSSLMPNQDHLYNVKILREVDISKINNTIMKSIFNKSGRFIDSDVNLKLPEVAINFNSIEERVKAKLGLDYYYSSNAYFILDYYLDGQVDEDEIIAWAGMKTKAEEEKSYYSIIVNHFFNIKIGEKLLEDMHELPATISSDRYENIRKLWMRIEAQTAIHNRVSPEVFVNFMLTINGDSINSITDLGYYLFWDRIEETAIRITKK